MTGHKGNSKFCLFEVDGNKTRCFPRGQPCSFFCESIDFDSVSVHKHAKERTGPISSHLDVTLGQ